MGFTPKKVSVSSGWRYLSRSALPGLRCALAIAAWMAARMFGYVLSASALAAACISGVQRASSALFSSCHLVRSSCSFLSASAFFFSSGVGSADGGAVSIGGGSADATGGGGGAGARGAAGGGTDPPHPKSQRDQRAGGTTESPPQACVFPSPGAAPPAGG